MPEETTHVRFKDGDRPVAFSITVDTDYQTQRNIHAHLRSGTFYELHTSRVFIDVLRPGDTFIDVGAHVGYYTMLARALVGEGGAVCAFEPNAITHLMLARNVAANGYRNVATFNCAVGDSRGSMPLYVNDKNEGECSLSSASATEGFPTPVMTLDDLGRGGVLKNVRGVKIDAEGWEGRILAGGAKFFSAYKPPTVVCEVNRSALARAGGSEMGIRDYFGRRGYDCSLLNLTHHDICAGLQSRRLAADEVLETEYVFNLLFTKS